MAQVSERNSFGAALRLWRAHRGMSQLDLAGRAEVSQRHISFLETGKAQPSREMVGHLGGVLDVPLRERNSLLVSAGFAPVHPERSIDDPELADVRAALEAMLEAHRPFPAYVIDRYWDLVLANEAALDLFAAMPASVQALTGNVLRLVLHPDGLRTVIDPWGPVAAITLRRIEREVEERPVDDRLRDLFDEVRSYPGLPGRADHPSGIGHDIVVPLSLTRDGTRLRFVSAMTRLGGATDVTVEELILETLLPADETTRLALGGSR